MEEGGGAPAGEPGSEAHGALKKGRGEPREGKREEAPSARGPVPPSVFTFLESPKRRIVEGLRDDPIFSTHARGYP